MKIYLKVSISYIFWQICGKINSVCPGMVNSIYHIIILSMTCLFISSPDPCSPFQRGRKKIPMPPHNTSRSTKNKCNFFLRELPLSKENFKSDVTYSCTKYHQHIAFTVQPSNHSNLTYPESDSCFINHYWCLGNVKDLSGRHSGRPLPLLVWFGSISPCL